MATRPAGTTNAMWWFWQQIDVLEPQAQLSGTWVRKTGYHGDVAWMRRNHPGNYSIQRAVDLTGPLDVGRAIDVSYADARAGTDVRVHKKTIIRITKRVAAAVRRGDSRMYDAQGNAKVREVIGTVDGRNTVNCSFHLKRVSTRAYDPNDSHLWHNHVSVTTKYVNDSQTYKDLLDIMFGDLIPEDEMPLDANDLTKIREALQAELRQEVGELVWGHERELSTAVTNMAGWPVGKRAEAWGLLAGADAAETQLLKLAGVEAARDAILAAATTGIRAAVAELGLGLPEDQLERLARRSSELTTRELIGEVTDNQTSGAEPSAGE